MKDSWSPQQYEKFKSQRSAPFFDLVNLLQPQSKAVAVDLGCGTGELTQNLHRITKAESTLGLDSSDEMLMKAQTFAGQGLSFQKQNIQNWVSPNQFDIVFSNAALQWCPDHAEIFKRLKQSLKAGGQIAIQMPMNHDYPTHTLAAEMAQEKKWVSLLKEPYDKQSHMLDVESYARLLFSLGFNEQKVFLRIYDHVLEDRHGVIEWVRGTLLTYFKSRLSLSDYDDFETEFRQRLFEKLPDDKPFFYPFKRILIWAR